MSLALRFVLPAALLASAASHAALAQGGAPKSPNPMENAIREDMERRKRAEEEWWRVQSLRMASKPRPAPVRPEPRLALAQIKEDFVRIQVVNNELAGMVARSRREPLDFKLVSKSAADIRKRAERLRDNLALPEFDKVFEAPQPQSPTEAERLKSSLALLRAIILEFVHNPHFDNTRLVDIQAAMKARRDLDDIIEVSGWVRQSSERLHKGEKQ
jgi:hypothetical protein